MFVIPQIRGRLATAAAFVALLGLGACGLVVGGNASADQQSGIATQRVIYRAIEDEEVVAAVLADEGVSLRSGKRCPVSRLRVSYNDPGPGWPGGGAFISPLAPYTNRSRRVSGIVRCKRSRYAFVGFQASLNNGEWTVVTVPDPEGGHDPGGEDVFGDHPGFNIPDNAPIPEPVNGPIATGGYSGADIEGYARYEGQKYCHPAAKSGTIGLRNLLLSHYPSTTSFGISRPCDMGGRSEHKEGRAFDWGVEIGDPDDLAAVQDFFRTIFDTDRHGNRHALVRRMGLMYAIWDGHIWTSYAQEWQPYSGTSPHTDHVHLSLSWAGALAMTSYWSGQVTDGEFSPPREVREAPWTPSSLLATPSPSPTASPTPKPKPATTVGPTTPPTRPPATTDPTTPPPTTPDPTTPPPTPSTPPPSPSAKPSASASDKPG